MSRSSYLCKAWHMWRRVTYALLLLEERYTKRWFGNCIRLASIDVRSPPSTDGAFTLGYCPVWCPLVRCLEISGPRQRLRRAEGKQGWITVPKGRVDVWGLPVDYSLKITIELKQSGSTSSLSTCTKSMTQTITGMCLHTFATSNAP